MTASLPHNDAAASPLASSWALLCSIVWAALYALGYAASAITPALGVASVVVLLVLVLAYRARAPSARRPWGWRAGDGRGAAMGLLIGVVSAVATVAVLPVFKLSAPWLAAEAADVHVRSGAALTMLPVVVFIACTEEIVWRGVLQSALVARFGAVAGIGGAALVYAAAQAPVQAWSVIAVALVLGAFWGVLRFRTGALWASMGAHTVWTLSQVMFP